MKKFLNSGFAILTAALFLLPAELTAKPYAMSLDNKTQVIIDAPSECAMKKAKGLYSCSFRTQRNPAGGKIVEGTSINLSSFTMPLGDILKDLGISQNDFSTDASYYLSALVEAIEQQVTSPDTPAKRKALIRADVRLTGTLKNPNGLTECLSFEFDFKDSKFKSRVTSSGARCVILNQKSNSVTVFLLEYQAGDDYTKNRPKGFERDAQKVLKSLRLR